MAESFAQKSLGFARDLPRNLFSGFVVSLIALPLGLGLALASGAPPLSGVLAAIIGGVVVSLFGSSQVTITGPGNGLVIVVLGAITTLGNGDLYAGYLYTLAAIIFSGVLLLLLGFLKMGRLADFFPSSAIEGMLAAIGWGIFAKQVHIMLGNGSAQGSILELVAQIPASLRPLWEGTTDSHLTAAGVGLISLLILVFYARIRNRYFQLIPAPMWILILTVGGSYALDALGYPNPLTAEYLIQLPEDGLTRLAQPDFGKLSDPVFWGSVLAITLIASIESLLSIKAVDKLDPQGRRSNVNRDLKALGLATVLSGLVGGLNVVTVIARSSVNVNNNATNRSSNFFHAAFLLLFLLLLGEQLKKIPLAALAAILVYTGYKLATPRTLSRIASVGREQIVIFLVTLICTLLTNLITGIGIGILTTLLIHMLINRSAFLFLRNVFKPNVLAFKEADGPGYYVSVKHFCSFLNFFRLKTKLDMIPEHEKVVLDLSICDFVDHTVMEGIESYVDAFERKGGSLEIIGLDKHGADSRHPFAIRKIIPLNPLRPIEEYFTRRQTQLKEVALEYGWTYKPERQTENSELEAFVFFRNRNINYAYNGLLDPQSGLSMMDVEYTEGEFIAREVIRATVLWMPLEHPLPVFTLDREGLLERLYSAAGYEEVLIPRHPEFNRRFFLKGEDREAVLDVFDDGLILFLESQPLYHVESSGEGLLVFKKERLLSIVEIKALLYFGQQLQGLLNKA